VKQKVLKGNPDTGECTATQADIAKALAGDQTYLRTMYLYNMENVLTELSAFLLVQRYGPLTPDTAYAILAKPDIRAWCARGFTYSPEDEACYSDEGAVLRPIYELLKWAIGQNYFTQAKYEIEASPRPKSYLARRPSIIAMRGVLLESDALVADTIIPWKKQVGVTFLQSLGDLR
jgi:hypothetical protein